MENQFKPDQIIVSEKPQVYEQLDLDKVPLAGVEHWFMGSTPRHTDLYKPEGINKLKQEEIEEKNRLRKEGYFYVPYMGAIVGLKPTAKLAIGFGQIDSVTGRIKDRPKILGTIEDVDGQRGVDTTRGEELTQKLYDYYEKEFKELYDQLIKI